jgi:hypothetical protein
VGLSLALPLKPAVIRHFPLDDGDPYGTRTRVFAVRVAARAYFRTPADVHVFNKNNQIETIRPLLSTAFPLRFCSEIAVNAEQRKSWRGPSVTPGWKAGPQERT